MALHIENSCIQNSIIPCATAQTGCISQNTAARFCLSNPAQGNHSRTGVRSCLGSRDNLTGFSVDNSVVTIVTGHTGHGNLGRRIGFPESNAEGRITDRSRRGTGIAGLRHRHL